MQTGKHRGSLLWLMDHTRTAFGRRSMRWWISHPLINPEAIISRQEAVEWLSHERNTVYLYIN